jgi:hypothetical protein
MAGCENGLSAAAVGGDVSERGRNPGPPFVCDFLLIAVSPYFTITCAIFENMYKIQPFGIAMYTRGIHILSRVLFACAF